MAPLNDTVEEELFGRPVARTKLVPKIGILVTVLISLSTFGMGFYSQAITRDTASEVRLSSLETVVKDKASKDQVEALIEQQKETNRRLASIEVLLMNGVKKHGN